MCSVVYNNCSESVLYSTKDALVQRGRCAFEKAKSMKKYLNYASLDLSQRFKNSIQIVEIIREFQFNRVIRWLTMRR